MKIVSKFGYFLFDIVLFKEKKRFFIFKKGIKLLVKYLIDDNEIVK